MGSRDRPHKEAKKKPKDAGKAARVQPLYEPPQQVELIRKPRKERTVRVEEDESTEQG